MAAIDQITTEVIGHRFRSATDEMLATLVKTAYSPNVKERRDCSAAGFDAKGDLVSLSAVAPLHLSSLVGMVENITRRFPLKRLRPGDVYLTNDPYVGGGSHLPDPTTRLRKLLEKPGCAMAPGVADALMGRLVARAGFEALYMTGNGTAAVRLGAPDIGLLTMTEMADNAARIADCAGIPLIADADDGYGNPFNVRRTVKTYEKAGVAALHIEDQMAPKRCGHLSGKRLIAGSEMAAKIKAAVDARVDQDFVIIARTDAIAVEGLNAALERAALYGEAGADLLFVEAPGSLDDIETIGRSLAKPQVFNMSTSGKTPPVSIGELGALGFKIAIYPNHVLYAAIAGARRLLAELKSTGSIAEARGSLPTFAEYHEILGLDEIQELEARYAVADDARVGV